ncbi:hypothetical protein OUZ56_006717 [Daphnia magna]|uniref:Uncharacterized protein n=1 Tax=Daphnia magna TaxID=35525 RepID=A0ABQ9YWH0_9CRUS|nr:hypothetical protein OUZ56_006717 [Daphnia magna]
MQFSWISLVSCVFGRLKSAELSRRLVVWDASNFPRTLRVVLRRRFGNLTAVLVDHFISKTSAEDVHGVSGKRRSSVAVIPTWVYVMNGGVSEGLPPFYEIDRPGSVDVIPGACLRLFGATSPRSTGLSLDWLLQGGAPVSIPSIGIPVVCNFLHV